MTWLYRWLLRRPLLSRRTLPIRRVPRRLEMTVLEDRVVPTISAWLDTQSLTISEGSSGGITVYRSGGDSSQPLTVSLAIEADGTGDPLAAGATTTR